MRISDWSSDVCSSDLPDQLCHRNGRPRAGCRAAAVSGDIAPGFQPHAADGADHADCTPPGAAGGQSPQGDCGGAPACAVGGAVFGRGCGAQPAGQIGRASCRESECPYVYVSVVAVTSKKKHNKTGALRVDVITKRQG